MIEIERKTVTLEDKQSEREEPLSNATLDVDNSLKVTCRVNGKTSNLESITER